MGHGKEFGLYSNSKRLPNGCGCSDYCAAGRLYTGQAMEPGSQVRNIDPTHGISSMGSSMIISCFNFLVFF